VKALADLDGSVFLVSRCSQLMVLWVVWRHLENGHQKSDDCGCWWIVLWAVVLENQHRRSTVTLLRHQLLHEERWHPVCGSLGGQQGILKDKAAPIVLSAMSHLRFYRATLTRDKVARYDFDAACDKQTWLPAIRMTMRLV